MHPLSAIVPGPEVGRALRSGRSRALIERFCLADDLSTHDPYDVWKTSLGLKVKNLFNRWPAAGLAPAAVLTLFDTFLNNGRRAGYAAQEYPIVRALAALSLLRLYERSREPRCLDAVRNHLAWLVKHSCTGFSGLCWGLGFPYPVTDRITYGVNTPLSTMTPYCLEALVAYRQASADSSHDGAIFSVYDFFERDIRVMESGDGWMATSYGPFRDRIVINAASYCMYSYALLLGFLGDAARRASENKIVRLFNFVARNQRADGSWLYSPQGRPFIDCFHSCIVLKNLIKTHAIFPLAGVSRVSSKGYGYVRRNFFDGRAGLFRRFTVANKPGIVRFDLYDNAEMLNLAILRGDRDLAERLDAAIQRTFLDGGDVYSQIDLTGRRRNRNTLRWAVMPYLYALSQLD